MLSDCPPSKPISILTSSAMGHHLRENAVDGIRVDERDLEPEQPLVRLGVDELGALALQRLQRDPDVGHLERNVMHARTARRKKPADGRVVAQRREELHPPGADEDGCGLDALLGHGGPVLELGPEEPRVRPERLVEIGDGHAEMMDGARVHARDASRAYSHWSGTTWDTPTKSLERDATAVAATRSSAGRCLLSSRTASANAWSVSRACSLSRSRFVSSDNA